MDLRDLCGDDFAIMQADPLATLGVLLQRLPAGLYGRAATIARVGHHAAFLWAQLVACKLGRLWRKFLRVVEDKFNASLRIYCDPAARCAVSEETSRNDALKMSLNNSP